MAKGKSQAQILKEDKAFCGWHKLTGTAKNGRKILRREPTSANIKIAAMVYENKGAKNLRITQITCRRT